MVSKKRPRVIYFPVDCMKGKAKRQYINQGKVRCYNMYEQIENIPSYKDLESMDKEQAKKIMTVIREFHTVKKISSQWKVSGYKFYNFLEALGLYENKSKSKGAKDKRTYNRKENTALDEVAVTNVAKVIDIPLIADPVVEKKESFKPFKGFKIDFANILTGEELANQILNIMGMLNKDAKYNFNFTVDQEL